MVFNSVEVQILKYLDFILEFLRVRNYKFLKLVKRRAVSWWSIILIRSNVLKDLSEHQLFYIIGIIRHSFFSGGSRVHWWIYFPLHEDERCKPEPEWWAFPQTDGRLGLKRKVDTLLTLLEVGSMPYHFSFFSLIFIYQWSFKTCMLCVTAGMAA